MDSADAWAAPQLFELDENTGRPLAVAGVPPDYFAADGQLWGNPLYRWEVHAADDYAWWHARLRAAFKLCDIVRIDHFRGFADYWRIPLPATTARKGEWRPGPGWAFFESVRRVRPGAKIIAEDLGELSKPARQLRRDTGLPGMGILQFAFGGKSTNFYLPHNLEANGVIYPGTHDNDTSLGWYATAGEKTRDHVRRYLRVSGAEVGWDFVRAAYAAVSRLAVIPMQDLLSLGAEGRFNTPGQPVGNWQWRYRAPQLDRLFGGAAGYLRELADLHGRLPEATTEDKPS
jgi:4-alpha-glucanotransferase